VWAIFDNLTLGTDEDARNHALLADSAVTHVINCAEELASYYPESFDYLRLELKDPDPSFRDAISPAIDFLTTNRKNGHVFVHCHGALSRSPSVILAYLCHLGIPITDAAAQLATVLPTRPNAIFLEQLLVRFTPRDPLPTISELHRILGGSHDSTVENSAN